MGTIANVLLRGRIVHFQRRIPDNLRPTLRLDELVRSLATSEVGTVKLRAYRLIEQSFIRTFGTSWFTALHQPRFEQIEFGPAEHLALHQVQAGDLPLGLAVRLLVA